MIRSKVKKKYLLRFFSVISSFFIWLYVVSSAEVELTKNIPIEIETPKGYAIANLVEREAVFRFKGPGLFVREFIEQEKVIKIKKDAYYKKGKSTFSLRLDRFPIKLPLGVELLSLEPRVLGLSIERKISKKLKVKPIFTQNLEDKYTISNVQIRPEYVKVSGPSSLIKSLDSIETKTIDGQNLISNKSIVTDLAFIDQRVNIDTSEVNISYVLESKLLNFTYNRIAIIFQSAQIIKNSSFREVSITLKGDRTLFDGLDQDGIKVFAEVDSRELKAKENKKTKRVELRVELPDGLELVELKPSEIEVELE